MTERDVRAVAEDLKRDFFDLMSRANQPDLLWDDGYTWAIAFNNADALGPEVDAAWDKLATFLRQHRSELEDEPAFAPFYADIDRETAEASERAVREQSEQRRAEWAEGASASPPNPGLPDIRPDVGRRP